MSRSLAKSPVTVDAFHGLIALSSSSAQELLIAKFRLKLKKVEKTTRPFKYDLNQIAYNYTMEVTNRFKGLDLRECLRITDLFVTLCRRQ